MQKENKKALWVDPATHRDAKIEAAKKGLTIAQLIAWLMGKTKER
jgi:hypothetical protein